MRRLPCRAASRAFSALRSIGLQPEDLEFHPHNASRTASQPSEGCAVINRTTLGKGERTGNAPLEAILMHLIGMGYFADAKPDFTALNELVDLYEAMDQPIPPKYPLCGRDAHRTRAGVHADDLNKSLNFFQNTSSIVYAWFLIGTSLESKTSITTILAINHNGRYSRSDL